jgi:F-type H+-transporting ATPase subunit epsilon
MRLVVTTPTDRVEDIDDVLSIRAEDETGAFGIMPGHADFVTVLPVSVVSWRNAGRDGFIAVRGGVLTVRDGSLVEIAARGAWREDELADLGPSALAVLEKSDVEEDETRKSEHRLQMATIRQIERLVRGTREMQSAAPRLEPGAARHGQGG